MPIEQNHREKIEIAYAEPQRHLRDKRRRTDHRCRQQQFVRILCVAAVVHCSCRGEDVAVD